MQYIILLTFKIFIVFLTWRLRAKAYSKVHLAAYFLKIKICIKTIEYITNSKR